MTLRSAGGNDLNVHFRSLPNHLPRQRKRSFKRFVGSGGNPRSLLARFDNPLANEEVGSEARKETTIDRVSKLFDCGLRFAQADLEGCLLQCDDSPLLVYMDEMATFMKRLEAEVATRMSILNEFIAVSDRRS